MTRTLLERFSARAPACVALLCLGVATLCSGAVAADALPGHPGASPEERVRVASDAVLALIEDARDWAKDDPERFYQKVHEILDPVIDFDNFARSVMAVHFRQATPEQRRRFADTFKWGLVRTYALALTEFRDGKVIVKPPDRPQRNPDRHTVTMEIVTSTGAVYPIHYSMAQNRNGEWQVRNIIVNGVNMGLTYRSQFGSAMNDPRHGGDMEKVIDAWGELLRQEAEELERSFAADERPEQGA
jgi:phospholipid transport system substrate-binding protein